MEVDSTSIEGVTSIPWVESMDKGMVPKRVITVGCNGPTKRNVTPEGISWWELFQSHAKDSKNHNDVSRALCFGIISDSWNVYMTLPNVLSWKEKNIYRILQKEIHLWIEISLETVESKVHWNGEKVWVFKGIKEDNSFLSEVKEWGIWFQQLKWR